MAAANDDQPRWEYTTAEFTNHKTFIIEASAMGAQGWRLVHIERVAVGAVLVGFFERAAVAREGDAALARHSSVSELGVTTEPAPTGATQ